MTPEPPHIAAHEHSSNHRDELARSVICGCFYCLATFPPSLITEWIGAGSVEAIARCPKCGIDSVIGDASGYPMTAPFLEEMRAHWFGEA